MVFSDICRETPKSPNLITPREVVVKRDAGRRNKCLAILGIVDLLLYVLQEGSPKHDCGHGKMNCFLQLKQPTSMVPASVSNVLGVQWYPAYPCVTSGRITAT